MTQEEILTGNRLIAEFMGAKPYASAWHNNNETVFFNEENLPTTKEEPCNASGVILEDKVGSVWHQANLKYHSSWDWLMPVTEKIRDLGFQFNLLAFKHPELPKRPAENGFRINKGNNIISFKENPDMKTAVWESIVGFIKKYNDPKPQPWKL